MPFSSNRTEEVQQIRFFYLIDKKYFLSYYQRMESFHLDDMDKVFGHESDTREGDDLINFLLDAAPLYAKYQKARSTAHQDPLCLAQCQDIYHEFCGKFSTTQAPRRDPRSTQAPSDFRCIDCGTEYCIVVSEIGSLVCTHCGVYQEGRAIQDDVKSNYPDARNAPKPPFQYKPSSYLRQHLNCIQGAEKTRIPHLLVLQLQDDLRDRKIPLSTVTPQVIHESLRRIKRPKFYKHRWMLAHQLNPAYHLMRISHRLEERVCALFEGCYRRLHYQLEANKMRRRNFVSYPLFLQCVFEHLGYDEAAREFAGLKGKENNQKQKQMIRAILAELSRPVVS